MPDGVADPFASPAAQDPFAADAAAEIPTVNAEGDVISPPPEVAEAPPEAPAVEAPEAAVEAAVEAPEAVASSSPAATASTAATTPAAPSEAARPPGPRGGKGDVRYYKLLYLSGPDQYTNFDLATVPDDIGVTVCKYAPPKELTELAEKKDKLSNATGEEATRLAAEVRSMEHLHEELWFEARNNEHANRLGFAIMGRPKDGVQIFPVPRGAWKPKTVKPAPPAPARERVVIS